MSRKGRLLRVDNPTPPDLDRCIGQSRLAILRGLMDGQAAARCWDLPYLRQVIGARPVSVVQQDEPRLVWHPSSGLPVRQVPFDRFAEAAFVRKDAGYAYLQDDVNNIPGLDDDYRLPAIVAEKEIVRTKVWLSGPGLITPLHYDPVETLHWMIRGSKRFLCYPPGLGRYYPYPFRSRAPFISRVDPDHPDPARYPRFQAVRPIEILVEEGEVLYLPAYYWHQVYSERPVNISLNFVWFTSAWKSLRFLPQFLRTRRHVARGLAHVQAARSQRARDGAPGARALPPPAAPGRASEGAAVSQYRVGDFKAPRQEVSRLARQAQLLAVREREALLAVGFPSQGVGIDVGCGPGFFAEGLRRALPALELFGLDIDPYVLREARGRLPVARGEATALPFAEGRLDFACCRLFLRHVTDPARVLGVIGGLVKPGGFVGAIDASDASLLLDPMPADFATVAAARREWFTLRGCSADVGHRLPDLFVHAGIGAVAVRRVVVDSATIGREAFAQIVLVPFLQAAESVLGDPARHAAAACAVEEWTRDRAAHGAITVFVVGGRRG